MNDEKLSHIYLANAHPMDPDDHNGQYDIGCCSGCVEEGAEDRELLIIEWLRSPNEDGSSCSAEREMLAQRLERGEHLK